MEVRETAGTDMKKLKTYMEMAEAHIEMKARTTVPEKCMEAAEMDMAFLIQEARSRLKRKRKAEEAIGRRLWQQ